MKKVMLLTSGLILGLGEAYGSKRPMDSSPESDSEEHREIKRRILERAENPEAPSLEQNQGAQILHLENREEEFTGLLNIAELATGFIPYSPAMEKDKVSSILGNIRKISLSGQSTEDQKRYAREWLKGAKDQGNAYALALWAYYELTGDLEIPKNPQQGIQVLRQHADAGEAFAQCHYGHALYFGRGVDQNIPESTKWFKKAADQGLAPAQSAYGIALFNGHGVEKNIPESTQWYKKAADQGYPPAQFNYGRALFYGIGVEKNIPESIQWYKKAADQGYAPAQFNYGNALLYGRGVEKNLPESTQWYKKAADQGYAPAQYNYGHALFNGHGIEKNIPASTEWCKKAADQGHVLAQRTLRHIQSASLNGGRTGTVQGSLPSAPPKTDKGKEETSPVPGAETSDGVTAPGKQTPSPTQGIGEPSSSTAPVQSNVLETVFKGALKLLQGENLEEGLGILKNLADKGFQKAKDFLGK